MPSSFHTPLVQLNAFMCDLLKQMYGTLAIYNLNAAFSLGLYDRIRGSYLDHAQCHVEWNHKDDDTVGGSSVTTIKVSL